MLRWVEYFIERTDLLQSGRGRRMLRKIVHRYREFVMRALFHDPASRAAPFEVPPNVQHFEDCAWLFESSYLNRGLLRMDFDEAALLFSLVRSQPGAQIVEIGRLRGGSTFLMAVAASDPATHITSIDISPRDDATLQMALEKIGKSDRVTLIVDDANLQEARPNFYDVVFIDGDHSYEGAKKDFEHWKASVKPGGVLLFHDAGKGRPYSSTWKELDRMMTEISQSHSEYFSRRPDVGSMASFTRTAQPFQPFEAAS
jgi:predicted O-methyltransferase YrrM